MASAKLKRITAEGLFNRLVNVEKLVGKTGQIMFSLSTVSMVVADRKMVGSAIQNWIGEYLKENNFSFAVKENTQEWPDFYLEPSNRKIGLLEVKVFDDDRSANFDIANFDAYCRSIKTDAYRLDSDYLGVNPFFRTTS